MDIRVQLQAERALIGSAISRSVADRNAAQYFAGYVEPVWFTHPPHQMIADAIIHCVRSGLSPDEQTIGFVMSSRKQLTDETEAAISLCVNATKSESVTAVEHYGTLVRDSYTASLIKERCLDVAEQADSYTPGSIEHLELSARGICDGMIYGKKVFYSMAEIDETLANPNSVPSYIKSLNQITSCGGYPSGEYSYWMSPRGTGKSSILIGEALGASLKHAKKTVLATLEMSQEQIKARALQMVTGFKEEPARDDWSRKYQAEKQYLQDYGFDVMACVGELAVWERFKSEIVRRTKSELVDFLVIDYIQRFRTSRFSSGRLATTRTDDLDYISDDLKNLASELAIPILTAAQPTQHLAVENAVEFTTKHARAIEEHAALMVNVLKATDGSVDCIVSKNRYGQSFVKLRLNWDEVYVTFRDATVST